MGASRSRMLHRSLRETPPKAIGGEGVWLIGEDGRRILDASGGAAVSCLGHQHPRVLEALSRQASKLAYAHTSFFSSEPAEALADKLVGHEPGGLAYAYFVSGGSEAIEAGIKLARQYFIETGQPQRQRFIARRQSYHGNTLGALAAGGNAWRREPYAPLLSSAFSHVTPAFAYHEKHDSESEADFVKAEPDRTFNTSRVLLPAVLVRSKVDDSPVRRMRYETNRRIHLIDLELHLAVSFAIRRSFGFPDLQYSLIPFVNLVPSVRDPLLRRIRLYREGILAKTDYKVRPFADVTLDRSQIDPCERTTIRS